MTVPAFDDPKTQDYGRDLVRGRFLDTGGAVYNVKAFGAVGDGVTDDTVAIQAAVTAGAGSTVHFPGNSSTVYLVSTAIFVPTRTRITMARGAKIFRKADSVITAALATAYANNVFTVGTAAGALYPAATPADWVIFEGLEIDGNCQNQSTYTGSVDFNKGGWGIFAKYATNVVIRDCYIHHCFAGGILAEFARGFVADNVECSYNAIQSNFGGTGNGFDLQGDTSTANTDLRPHVLVTNCKAHHNGDEGFVVSNMSGINFSDCQTWNNGNSTASTNSVYGFEVTGATVTGSDYVSNIQFNNCTSDGDVPVTSVNRNGRGSGIKYYGYGAAANVQFNNVRVTGATAYGLIVNFVNNVAVGRVQLSNVIIDGFGCADSLTDSGIVINVPAGSTVKDMQLSNVIVTGGSTAGTTQGGINIGALSTGVIQRLTLIGCHAVDGPYDGIFLSGTINDISLVGCKANGNRGIGCWLSPGAGKTMNTFMAANCQFNGNALGSIASHTSGLLLAYSAGSLTRASIIGCEINNNTDGAAGVGLNIISGVGACYVDAQTQITGNTTANISDGSARLTQLLSVSNSAAGSTPGTCVKKIQVFNQAGTSLGYIPVYDAIT